MPPERTPVSPDQIVEAAIEVTAAEGLEAASLRRVAEAAGASKSSILHHFGSADALRRAMFRRVAQVYQELAAPPPERAGTGATERLGVLDAIFQERNRDFLCAAQELTHAASRDPEMAEEARATIEGAVWMVAALLGPPRESAVATARHVYAVCNGYIVQWLRAGERDPKPWRELAQAACAALIRERERTLRRDG